MLSGNRFVRVMICLGLAGVAVYSVGAIRARFSSSPASSGSSGKVAFENSPSFSNQDEMQRKAISGISNSVHPVNSLFGPFSNSEPSSAPMADPMADSSLQSSGELVASEPPLVSTDGQEEKNEGEPASGFVETATPENFAAVPQPYYPDLVQQETAEEKGSSTHADVSESESRDPSSLNSTGPLLIAPGVGDASTPAVGGTAGSAAISDESFNQDVPFASLTGGDYQALNTSMKGSFAAGTEMTSGTLCQVEQPVCSYQDQYSVNSRSWAMQKVLQEDVNFQIRKVGQSLSFDVGFKVVTYSDQEEKVSFKATPISVNPHREFENSKNYRVLDFTFPNMKIHGESVKNVRASLVFEETSSGLELTNQSKFTFQRNNVALDVADSSDYFTAEDLNFSINVEKLL